MVNLTKIFLGTLLFSVSLIAPNDPPGQDQEDKEQLAFNKVAMAMMAVAKLQHGVQNPDNKIPLPPENTSEKKTPISLPTKIDDEVDVQFDNSTKIEPPQTIIFDSSDSIVLADDLIVPLVTQVEQDVVIHNVQVDEVVKPALVGGACVTLAVHEVPQEQVVEELTTEQTTVQTSSQTNILKVVGAVGVCSVVSLLVGAVIKKIFFSSSKDSVEHATSVEPSVVA